MPSSTGWTDEFVEDMQTLDGEQYAKLKPSFEAFQSTVMTWNSGALPIEDFPEEMDVHQTAPGIFAFAWDYDGRCTFKLLEMDRNGHSEKVLLLNVGTHRDVY